MFVCVFLLHVVMAEEIEMKFTITHNSYFLSNGNASENADRSKYYNMWKMFDKPRLIVYTPNLKASSNTFRSKFLSLSYTGNFSRFVCYTKNFHRAQLNVVKNT